MILGLFGLVEAGVPVSSVGAATVFVLLGLLVGKPLGITGLTWVGDKLLGLEKPRGVGYGHVVTLGLVAGVGFTVALFLAAAAFEPGPIQDAAKMGALGSLLAGALAIPLARLCGIRPEPSEKSDHDS